MLPSRSPLSSPFNSPPNVSRQLDAAKPCPVQTHAAIEVPACKTTPKYSTRHLKLGSSGYVGGPPERDTLDRVIMEDPSLPGRVRDAIKRGMNPVTKVYTPPLRAFYVADVDNDGVLSASEFINFIRTLPTFDHMSTRQAEEIFHLVAKEKDAVDAEAWFGWVRLLPPQWLWSSPPPPRFASPPLAPCASDGVLPHFFRFSQLDTEHTNSRRESLERVTTEYGSQARPSLGWRATAGARFAEKTGPSPAYQVIAEQVKHKIIVEAMRNSMGHYTDKPNLTQITEVFTKLDTNHDHKIDLNEFHDGMKAIALPNAKLDASMAIFREIDINKNMAISLDEFVNWLLPPADGQYATVSSLHH